MARISLYLNSSRFHLKNTISQYAAAIPDNAIVLDAGAGISPYKNFFSHAVYESADIAIIEKDYKNLTYVCDLKNIPVKDQRFDYIIFNQVLEHVPEPELVLKELHRVLKTSGKILYTGPFYYEEHEKPYDYYRYTQFGLKYLFEKFGFEIDELTWLEGYYGTIAYQFKLMRKNLPIILKPYFLGILLLPFNILIKLTAAFGSFLFSRLDKKYKYQEKGHPKNYILYASKKNKP
ncbi:MAG: class I SAM-dependent methyltransferase [Spirochaetales bacterium]|nr:class I SAM-dependent methyltransferase [Spirochaetales bacterium]